LLAEFQFVGESQDKWNMQLFWCYLYYWFLNLLLVKAQILPTVIYFNPVLPVLASPKSKFIQSSCSKLAFHHLPQARPNVPSDFLLYRSKSTVCSVHSTMCSVHSTVCSVQSRAEHWA
jgi:hypothetical protein